MFVFSDHRLCRVHCLVSLNKALTIDFEVTIRNFSIAGTYLDNSCV